MPVAGRGHDPDAKLSEPVKHRAQVRGIRGDLTGPQVAAEGQVDNVDELLVLTRGHSVMNPVEGLERVLLLDDAVAVHDGDREYACVRSEQTHNPGDECAMTGVAAPPILTLPYVEAGFPGIPHLSRVLPERFLPMSIAEPGMLADRCVDHRDDGSPPRIEIGRQARGWGEAVEVDAKSRGAEDASDAVAVLDRHAHEPPIRFVGVVDRLHLEGDSDTPGMQCVTQPVANDQCIDVVPGEFESPGLPARMALYRHVLQRRVRLLLDVPDFSQGVAEPTRVSAQD